MQLLLVVAWTALRNAPAAIHAAASRIVRPVWSAQLGSMSVFTSATRLQSWEAGWSGVETAAVDAGVVSVGSGPLSDTCVVRLGACSAQGIDYDGKIYTWVMFEGQCHKSKFMVTGVGGSFSTLSPAYYWDGGYTTSVCSQSI